jgi:hypothetical protein
MPLVPLVVMAGSRIVKHGIAESALEGRSSMALGRHVVNKTTLRRKCLAALLAPKVVLLFEMELQLGDSSETVSAELARWPVPLFVHVKDHLLVMQEFLSACIALV